jgi:dnd system-associated protein 4
MATIRIPQDATPFLPLCRSHSGDSHDRTEQVCFETYADLMVFAAALGYEEMGGKLPMRETRFLDRPNPIDLQTFKNDRRYPPILLIALAASKDRAVVRDEDLLCKITEDFAAVGCERLKKTVDRGVPGGWHLAIAKRLTDSSAAPSEDQI